MYKMVYYYLFMNKFIIHLIVCSTSGEIILENIGEDTETEKVLFDSTTASMIDKMTTDQSEINGNGM